MGMGSEGWEPVILLSKPQSNVFKIVGSEGWEPVILPSNPRVLMGPREDDS